MNDHDDVMALPPLNDSFDPARPWVCVATEPHECTGEVVGSLGAQPVCAAGAEAVRAAFDHASDRFAARFDDPVTAARQNAQADAQTPPSAAELDRIEALGYDRETFRAPDGTFDATSTDLLRRQLAAFLAAGGGGPR